MNRRTFLTALGIAPAAAKALPDVPVSKPSLPTVEAVQQARKWLVKPPSFVSPAILLPNQRKLFECDAPEVLLTGSIGGGKTFAARKWLKEPLFRSAQYRGLYVDASNHRASFGLPRPAPICETNAVSVIRDHKVRGWLFQRIVIDNAIEWEYGEEEYVRLMGCLRAHKVPVRPQIVVVAIPSPNRPAFSWIKRRFIDNPHPDRAVISLNIRDNPFLWHDAAYRANLEKYVPDQLAGVWK